MLKSLFAGRRSRKVSYLPAMIEGLESRELLSAAPFKLFPVTPGKILAPAIGYEKVAIHNTTADPVTESVTISLAPSLDGSTAAYTFSSGSLSQTVTLKKHGTVTLKVPFVPSTTAEEGKYHTLVSVDIDGTSTTATAPGAYKLTVPPAPTTTPSLVGTWNGMTSGSAGTGEGGTITHEYGFIWQITDQTLTGLTGTFTIGDGHTTGTMQGSEDTTGGINFTLTSDNINYTISGKLYDNGTVIKGTIHGTLVNNLFKRVDGKFTMTLQTS